MAISLPRASRSDFFERHIRRLAWYTLLASIALLTPIARKSDSPVIDVASGLGALVIVVAVFTVMRDVGIYVRQEQQRRREATAASQQTGACLAAAAIQDRIANSLAVTVGYVELVAEAEALSPEARDQADLAVQAARTASRAVSAFRDSLDCPPETLEALWAASRPTVEPAASPRTITLLPSAPPAVTRDTADQRVTLTFEGHAMRGETTLRISIPLASDEATRLGRLLLAADEAPTN